jgi:hypothetical protein
MLPFRIKADVSYHASLQAQGRCYLSCLPSGSRPILAIILPFMINADVSYHASLQDILKGSMIANIGINPEGKYDS